MYPDRLIRPLPKRRLRQRLSEEEASSIEFPPNPPQVAPLFSVPYVGVDKPGFSGVPLSGGVSTRANINSQSIRGGDEEHHCDCGHDHGVAGEDFDGEGADEAIAGAQQEGRPMWDHAGGGKPQGPGSTTSSADGYESFENTNNKKKRKIPLSGGGHHSSLSADMVNMTISSATSEGPLDDASSAATHHYASSTMSHSGTGISGAGRGRFGRPKHSMERRPLGASTNGLNAFAKSHSGISAKGKREWVAEGKHPNLSLHLKTLTSRCHRPRYHICSDRKRPRTGSISSTTR